MKSILETEVVKKFIRMCEDGVAMGWHERNGGNLSYRMTAEDIEECRPYFKAEKGMWTELGICAENLKSEFFMVTGSGKFLKNVCLVPQDNMCIVQINEKGDASRVVWGLEKGGRPTSEFPTHFMNHSVRKRVTKGANRIIYHAHPPYTIALTYVLPMRAEAFTRTLWKSATECCVVFPDGVGVLPWMVPGGTQIAKETCALMEKFEAVIWAFHGMFVAGSDFDTAFGLMHTIEKAAQIASTVLAAAPDGKPRQVITDEDLHAIGRDFGVTLNEEMFQRVEDEQGFY